MLTKKQINLIVDEIKSRQNIDGIIISGSYVNGVPNDESDLDIRMVTNDGSNLDDRNSTRFKTRIEAFYNTPEKVRRYFNEAIKTGDETIINIWVSGKIFYDPNGIVSQLQKEAKAISKKGSSTGEWKTRPEYSSKMSKRKTSHQA